MLIHLKFTIVVVAPTLVSAGLKVLPSLVAIIVQGVKNRHVRFVLEEVVNLKHLTQRVLISVLVIRNVSRLVHQENIHVIDVLQEGSVC